METEAEMETEAAPAFFLVVCDGDTVTVGKMLSAAGAQFLINYQDSLDGWTPLHIAAFHGQVAVTTQLLAARCNVDLQTKDGCTPLYLTACCRDKAVD